MMNIHVLTNEHIDVLRYGTIDTNKRLSKEDIEFLQGAIKDALSQIEDPYEAINEAVRNFENKDEGIILASAKIVERLVDEYPEVARNLDKIKAVDPLLKLLDNNNNHILESVLQIFSLALSNNPELQDSVFKKNALKKLLIKLQESQKTVIDKKLITAISALIRHHDEAENKFIDYGGIGFLVYGMQTNIYKYQEKSALLLKHLIHQNKITFELFLKNEIMKGLICLANNKNIDETGIQYGETTAELFLALMQNHRHKLAKAGYLHNLKKLIEDRLVYLRVVQNSASYDVSHEIELFNDCLKLTNQRALTEKDRRARDILHEKNKHAFVIISFFLFSYLVGLELSRQKKLTKIILALLIGNSSRRSSSSGSVRSVIAVEEA
ncbi:conserved Plasmodium protein, unknown function [Plasmodium malariae]|uniref:Uncharacterized protein n=1 Tax=Plasmodium malariae TaxID=5858 RepID=A0A1A8VQM9_PLAMA|nr:conserved Plasmodium protein, unknown function [Plasmodium malariae]